MEYRAYVVIGFMACVFSGFCVGVVATCAVLWW